MGKLLEKILSPARTLVTAAVITAAIAGIPNEAQGKGPYDYIKDYTYFTQSKNITGINTQLPAKKGLLKKEHGANIRSRGAHQQEERAPIDHEKIKIRIGYNTYNNEKEKYSALYFDYRCSPKNKISRRIPIVQQIFREDPTNTHIYLALPEEVEILREYQKIHTTNNQSGNWHSFDGIKLGETKLGKALKKYNEAIGKRNVKGNELEKAFDNTTNLIGGKTGKTIEVIKKGMKLVLEKEEEKRIENIRKTYGEDIQIYKMPFFQKEDIFKYTQRGRLHNLILNVPKSSRKDSAYLIIPKMSFLQEVPGVIRIASIEDLIFEIPLDPKKMWGGGFSVNKDGYVIFNEAIPEEAPHKLGEVIKLRNKN